jgi:hypothetical protein
MQESRTYYLFLGFHSFLIGLFPFFLPVFLIRSGYSLPDVSLFIGLTGFSFCSCLFFWDRMCRKVSFFAILLFSFGVELVVVLLLTFGGDGILLPFLALVNGIYNCLFWMVQRIFFYSTTTAKNSGRKFGNFQIFVTVILKAGIFIGGCVLDNIGVEGVLLLSFVSAATAVYMFIRSGMQHTLPEKLLAEKPLRAVDVVSFSDHHGSRPVFCIDGVFLYLESYFWLISLFYIMRQSFWQLGLLVIVLAVAFSVLFYIIKNRIDSRHLQGVYVVAVGLYALSWLMRGALNVETGGADLYLLLILITFCTSFFRLALNKRFFDIARTSGGYSYIFCKSYYSQFFLALFFCCFAFFVPAGNDIEMQLRVTYTGGALLALLYLLYCEVKS